MSGGGKGSQTVTQSNVPWKEATPYLKEILGEASDIYGRGSTFVEANPYQTQGLESIASMAQQGNPLSGATTTQVGDIISSGGLNQQQQDVAGSLMPYATGQYLSGGNPYLDDLIKQSGEDVTDMVKSASAGLGRSGGNAYNTGELTRELGKLSTGLRYGDYNQQVQNQMGAANQLFGANAQGQQQALQASSLAPTINEFRYSDPSKLASVGGALRGFEQEQVNAPWSDLSKYAGIVNPTGGGGSGFGTSTQTSSGGSDPLSAILGIASLGSSFFGNPFGAAGAGSLWGPGQLITASDERLKEDIEPIGETFGGIPIYKYAYKDDPTHRTQIGVMAQDMLEKKPEAVAPIGGGFLGVDYSQVS